MAAPRYSPEMAMNLETMVLPIGVQMTSTTAAVVAFPAPFSGRLKYMSVNATAAVGAATVDVQAATVSLLNAPIAVVAVTDTEAVLATSTEFSKDDAMTVDVTVTTSIDHLTVTLIFERD